MNLDVIREFALSIYPLSFLPLSPMAIIIFLIQSTLFLLLVLIVDRLLKSSAASERKFLWFWAMMMIPTITILANFTPATRADSYLATVFDLSNSKGSALNNEVALTLNKETLDVPKSIFNSSLAELSAGSGLDAGSRILAGVKNWDWLVSTYCLFALLLLARIPIGWKQLARLRQTSAAAGDERGVNIYKQVAIQVGYRGACQVRLSRELESPVSFGIRKPVILFPGKYYAQLSDTELRATLLHELSHIKNRDPLRILLLKVIESLFFFQPLVWLASSRLHYLSELVADDSVLEGGVEASRYANTIVKLIELCSEPSQRYKLSTGIFSSPRMVVSRMEHLLDDASSHRTRLVGRRLFTSAFMLLAALSTTVQFSPRSSALDIGSGSRATAKDPDLDSAPLSEESSFLAEDTEQFEVTVIVDRAKVVFGESIVLTIRTGDARAKDLDLITSQLVDDFEVLQISISNPSRTNNGVVELLTDWVLTIRPFREGVLTIPSFTIGNQQTNPIDIEVTSATRQQLSQNSDRLFLEIKVNKNSVFVNEEIELLIKLSYTINGIRNPLFTELLLPNSVIQSIDTPKQYEERIDGVHYGVYEKRYTLTPQKAGPLEIPDIRFQGDVDGNTRGISAFVEGLTIDVTER